MLPAAPPQARSATAPHIFALLYHLHLQAMAGLPVKWCCRTDDLVNKQKKARDFQLTISPT